LKYIIHLLFTAGVCLLTSGAAFVFDCFFFPSTFSTGADACCCFVDVFVTLVELAGLLFSSLATTFLDADDLLDVDG
jgi:hypothetical protein